MPDLILLNKPYGVICQFSSHPTHPTLSSLIDRPGFYAAGRLDTDSEGLLLLTDHGGLNHRITDPRHKLPKTYWVQVEGVPDELQLQALREGVDLGDFMTQPAQVQRLAPPEIWARQPPIRVRKHIPDSWLALTIHEGKNRQVRRMTAKVGLPTLRLIRVQIGEWALGDLQPGEQRVLQVSLPPVVQSASVVKPGARTARHGVETERDGSRRRRAAGPLPAGGGNHRRRRSS